MREFNGRHYILEEAIQAISPSPRLEGGSLRQPHVSQPPAISTPWRSPPAGVAVVEVEEIVEVGALDPDEIHLPGIYVDRLIQGTFEKTSNSAPCARA